MRLKTTYLALAMLAGFGLALGACSSSSDDPAPDYTLSDAQKGATIPAGTHTVSGDLADAFDDADAVHLGQDLQTGETVKNVGGLDFGCAMGPCSATLNDNGTVTTTGTIEVVMAGGEFQAASLQPAPVEPEPDPADVQRKLVDDAISAANTAIAALTSMSSDADVAAAQDAIDAATTALNETTALPAGTVVLLQGQIATAQENLDAAETRIAEYKTHQNQLNAANMAVGAAQTAVAGLNADSTDADVTAAEQAIAAAKQAVMDGTALTESEKSALNGDIATAETNLTAAKTAIAARKGHDSQLKMANEAVTAATTAVAGLSGESTDAEVTAAEKAITDAEAAVAAGANLTDSEKTELNLAIATAKLNLTNAKTDIASTRLHQGQLTAANNAVDAAKMAVDGLDSDSTDAEVEAAEDAIAAAKKAVMDGTELTDSEKTALNGSIQIAETSLGTVKLQIALRKERDTQQELNRLYGEASGATEDAKAAGKAADQALKNAEDYDGKIGVLAVEGDSAMAQANAQKVLDARDSATTAAQNAVAAKKRATDAKTDATKLAETLTGKTAVIAALDAAIKEAEAQITHTTDIRDGNKLKMAVEMVTGTAKEKKTAADRGDEVANLIFSALTTNTQLPSTVAAYAGSGTTSGKNMKGPSDAQGVTWEQIESDLVEKQIAAGASSPATSRTVKAVSMNGKKTASLFDNVPSWTDNNTTKTGIQIDSDTEYDDSNAADDPSYRGIRGVLFCEGVDCEIDGTGADQKLKGSWFFAPDGTEDTYIASTNDSSVFSKEDPASYVQFGYWLSVASATDSTTTINRYIGGPAASGAGMDAASDTVEAFKDATASYTGDALGMSVVWTTDTKGKEVDGSRASGAFEADVSLTLSFGSNPSLKGTISNFEGSAVDTDWTVDLDRQTLTGGSFTNGQTDGGDTLGVWTANVWGGMASDSNVDPNPAKRPVGVYGAFDANFSNGHAAGVYATRKQ